MDLGCLNLGCIEKQSKEISLKDEDSNAAKSNIGVLNKLTSQIKKSPNSKSSPINWFPRKKVDSFLKRKIQHLQEADGMNLTLDETLGDANPHYSRVLKEKMAVREAAHKAMEARKAAMVEASWFRILKAARIESKVAEEQLLKAEEHAAKAFEAATAIGVIMNDAPGCPTKRYKIETSSPNGGSTTHTIKASFETAFDVDKQVAVAVKSAFMKLEDCPSIDKDDLKKLLRKISEHPDLHEHSQEQSEGSSDCESDVGGDTRVETRKKAAWDTNYVKKKTPVSQKKQKKRHVVKKFTKENLVDIMLERLRGLPEDGLSSLATIVATCGLSAALAEAEIGNSSTHHPLRSTSLRKETPDSELPSLDKFLVKRLTRLEREVLEAKNARKNEQKPGVEAKESIEFVPSLDTCLVKRMSRLEKEVEEAKNRRASNRVDHVVEKENMDMNTNPENHSTFSESLDKVFVKRVPEIRHSSTRRVAREKELEEAWGGEGGLDQVLVKHKSKLEIEKAQTQGDTQIRHSSSRRVAREKELEKAWGGLSLGNSMHPPRPSKLDKDKQPTEVKRSSARRDAREKELQEAWGGLSLGNSMRPHLSKLEKDKAAWLKAAEEERRDDVIDV